MCVYNAASDHDDRTECVCSFYARVTEDVLMVQQSRLTFGQRLKEP